MTVAPGPVLTTERLILRPTALEDFEPWAAMVADEAVMRFLGGVQTRNMAWRGLMTMAGSWTLQGFGMFSLLERDGGAWVGRIGPWRPDGWPQTEVGWGLTRQAWGKGYAVEAATAAMDFAFDQLGWETVVHYIDPQNTPSQAVARRLGSVCLGPERMPPPFDAWPTEAWGQTRAQWRARRGA